MNTKTLKFEVSEVKFDQEKNEGVFSGFASAWTKDSDAEIVDKGAFRRTLGISGGKVPILWQHTKTDPCGYNVAGEETDRGLAVSGRLALGMSRGRDAYEWLKLCQEVGGRAGLSIGFRATANGTYVKDGIRHFKEVELLEYSIVTFPANQDAYVTDVKANDPKTRRVAGEDLSADAFAYVGDPDKTETWKLPIKFSTDAKTKRHIRNALARFSQTQGIPDSERAAVLARIHRAAKQYGIDVNEDGKQEKDFAETFAESNRLGVLYDERRRMEDALSCCLCNVLYDGVATPEEKKLEIADSFGQYGAAMTDWYARYIDAMAEDTDNKDDKHMSQEKAGRAISAASAEQIKAAMGHLMDAGALHQKAIGILQDLSKRPYTANDVNEPNPAGGGKSAEELEAEAKAAAEAAAEKAAKEQGDSEKLHSLLELTRSVATKLKAA